jgi:hypothetical protein
MYYIPKKNRCRCSDVGINIGPCNIFTLFAKSSGLHTSIKASNNVYLNSQNLDETKGIGNVIKRGSGGNSYQAYIYKIKGNRNCCI